MRISDWSSDVCSSDLFVNGSARGRFPLSFEIPGWSFHGGQGFTLNDFSLDIPFPDVSLTGGTAGVGSFSVNVPDIDIGALFVVETQRSEERRVGKECVSTCGSRWVPYH